MSHLNNPRRCPEDYEPLGPDSFGGSDERSHYVSQTRIRGIEERKHKVYVAAAYEMREEAIRVKTWLEARSCTVTSTWLTTLDEEGDKGARIDLDDVARADVFLAINPEAYRRSGTGGRHVEFGYAIALGKQVVILGVRSNIFHHLSNVRVIERLEDL